MYVGIGIDVDASAVADDANNMDLLAVFVIMYFIFSVFFQFSFCALTSALHFATICSHMINSVNAGAKTTCNSTIRK